MKKGKSEVTAVLVAGRQRLRRNAAGWAAARRRALVKAVEYNEALLTRLRARLDEEPHVERPPARPEAPSPDSVDSSRNDASAGDEKGAWRVPPTPPSDQHAEDVGGWGKAASTVTAPAVPVSEPPASEETARPRPQREPIVSSWLPSSVAEAYPARPEPTP